MRLDAKTFSLIWNRDNLKHKPLNRADLSKVKELLLKNFQMLTLFILVSCSGKKPTQNSVTQDIPTNTAPSSSQNEPLGEAAKSPTPCEKYTVLVAQCWDPLLKTVKHPQLDRYDRDSWKCGIDAFAYGIFGKSGAEGCEDFRCEDVCQ